MDKFEQKEMKKVRPIKNTWYDRLINYIPEPKRKHVGGFKDKILSLFKTNTPKETVYGRGKKLSKPKTRNIRNSFIYIYIYIYKYIYEKKKSSNNKNIWTLFETKTKRKKKKLIID